MRELVFGYGSLLGELSGAPALLLDHRRCWGVAMDNRVDIPGYRFFLAAGGTRPAVDVAFLDIVPAPGEEVQGICQAVDVAQLAALDRRERNYARTDVSALVPGTQDRVWAYHGLEVSRARFSRGRERGSVVVSRDYAVRCRADTGELPVLELQSVALAG